MPHVRYFSVLHLALLLLFFATAARAEYTADELIKQSRTAHAELSRYSMQVWGRAYRWSSVSLPSTESTVSTIVKGNAGHLALVSVNRETRSRIVATTPINDRITRIGFRMTPGPRFLVGEWSDAKNKLIDRPVVQATYAKQIRENLSEAFLYVHPFDDVLFPGGRNITVYNRSFIDTSEMRVAGRENIAGHLCIRLDTKEATLWFDTTTFLIRRILYQNTGVGRSSGEFRDVFCDIRPLGIKETANLFPEMDETFEDKAMQWVPFIPIEQLKENIRITGRAAGLLIAPPADQPLAQPVLPPITPEQRAAIVTIEGDVLSGLGFFISYQSGIYLVTDVRFITQNRWLKVRDHQGATITFTETYQADKTRVALLKTNSVPAVLTPSDKTKRKKSAALFLLCAFDKKNAVMTPAFCVSRSEEAGIYEVSHPLSGTISGGPILNVDDETVAGVLIKSDRIKLPEDGPARDQWHYEALFDHPKWIQIGSVPQR